MDSGAIANILRRPVTAGENPAIGRITLSVRLAVAVAAAQGGRAELARELQSLAGRYPLVRLVQAPNAPARLEAGPFRWPIAAALRDALLTAVRAPAATSPTASTSAATMTAAASSDNAVIEAALTANGFRGQTHAVAVALPNATTADIAASSAAARSAPGAASMQGALPAASAPSSVAASPTDVIALATASQRAAAQWPAILMTAPPPLRSIECGTTPDAPAHRLALSLPAPLLDGVPDAAAAAVRLSGALRDSGLFTEARLARRLASAAAAAAATETTVLRELARLPAELTLGERTAAQLEVLRRDAAAFVLTAWSGQKASVDLGRERINADGSVLGTDAAAPVFFAALHLDLPRLGAVTLRLRLVHSTVAASVEAGEPEPWRAALPELAAQLSARGLQTAALVAAPARRNDDGGA